MLGLKPQKRCRNSNNGSEMIMFPSISHIPNEGTSLCFPYPGLAGVKLLAYAGWVLPKLKEGYSRVMLASLLKSSVVKYTFQGIQPRLTKPTYDLSL